MKKLITAVIFLFFAVQSFGQKFEEYFLTETLRLDLIFAGNKNSQNVYLSALRHEPIWGGSQTNLIDNFNYGEYRVEVYSMAGEKIYSYGFSTLFQEWRTTSESEKSNKAFTNTVWLPFPKNKVKIEILERDKSTNCFKKFFETEVDPQSIGIMRDKPNDFNVVSIINNGSPAKKVDLVFVAEGYTTAEMQKFIEDVKRHVEYLFSVAPFDMRKNDFNIWAVESVSKDSGTDIPGKNIWKNTVANSTFYTFGVERYLTAPDHKAIADLVWNTPHDQIYVLVNTEKYGGGGIYNFYSLGSTHNKLSLPVSVHEFGHAFAGLGDEYYTSDVAYEDFYNMKFEPWEPNITSLVNFSEKWKDLVGKDTPIPTPATEKYFEKVGAFEGAGYIAKGLYRPYIDCRMKTTEAKNFCPVCQRAINRMIDWYCK